MPQIFESMFLSELATDVPPGEIARIVRVSRANNAAEALTGVLLFDGARFCQSLEGPEEAVRNMVTKIAADPRHMHFQLLHVGPSQRARYFEAWHVGTLAPDGPSPLLAFASLRGPVAIEHLMTILSDSHKLGIHVL